MTPISSRPTPETDARIQRITHTDYGPTILQEDKSYDEVVDVAFARRLEQQRDAAVEALLSCRVEYAHQHGSIYNFDEEKVRTTLAEINASKGGGR